VRPDGARGASKRIVMLVRWRASDKKSLRSKPELRRLVVVSLAATALVFAELPLSSNAAEIGGNAPTGRDSQPQQPNRNLSEKLNSSGGVIAPPANVDPQIRVPAPPTGDKMPVLPAPKNSPEATPK
jgi:hypothetical protein